MSIKKVAILIDGGHMRVLARKAGRKYDPDYDYIEKLARAAMHDGEELLVEGI